MPKTSKRFDEVKEVETVDIDRVDDLPEPPQKQQPISLSRCGKSIGVKRKSQYPQQSCC